MKIVIKLSKYFLRLKYLKQLILKIFATPIVPLYPSLCPTKSHNTTEFET